MSACDACWNEAFVKSRTLGGSQADWYRQLLEQNEGDPDHDAHLLAARSVPSQDKEHGDA